MFARSLFDETLTLQGMIELIIKDSEKGFGDLL
jgi:hypothetical protein